MLGFFVLRPHKFDFYVDLFLRNFHPKSSKIKTLRARRTDKLKCYLPLHIFWRNFGVEE